MWAPVGSTIRKYVHKKGDFERIEGSRLTNWPHHHFKSVTMTFFFNRREEMPPRGTRQPHRRGDKDTTGVPRMRKQHPDVVMKLKRRPGRRSPEDKWAPAKKVLMTMSKYGDVRASLPTASRGRMLRFWQLFFLEKGGSCLLSGGF